MTANRDKVTANTVTETSQQPLTHSAAQQAVLPQTLLPQESAPRLSKTLIDTKTALLEATFNHICLHRMQDVPILNHSIKVRCIGFQQWQNSYLCIMITPWFMNLMLLPGEAENWHDKTETAACRHTFPSGQYEFLVGYEPDIGKYQMCSLFSPMFEFSDNDAAVQTAEAAIKELMNTDNIEHSDIDSEQLEAIWNGTEVHPDRVAARDSSSDAAKDTANAQPRPSLSEKLQQPVSRRRLLRGAMMLEQDEK